MPATQQRAGVDPDTQVVRLLDEAVRLLATLIRLQVENQTAAIVELGRAGLPAARIGELLGTTGDTAKVTLSRAKKNGRTSVARRGPSHRRTKEDPDG